MIYVINMLLILIYAWILKPDGKSGLNRRIFCTLVVVQFTCISGFQYGVGKDYFSYWNIYRTVQKITWEEARDYLYFREPVFLAYTKIMTILFGENPVPYFCGMAFACAFFLIKALCDRREHIVWSLYIYLCMGLFYVSMNQIRQQVALTIILYSIQFLENKKACKYFFWILIAAGIHNSALIMLPCYMLNSIDIKNRKTAIKMFLLVCLATFAMNSSLQAALKATPYGWMMEWQAGSQLNMLLNLIYRAALLLGSLIYIRQVLNRDKKYKVLYLLSMIGIVFQIISVSMTSIGRITTYFYAVFIFLIPVVISCIPRRRMRLVAKYIVMLGMMCYHFFYLNVNLGGMEYTSVFQMK